MRRTFLIGCAVLLLVGSLAGCVSTPDATSDQQDPKKIQGAPTQAQSVYPGSYSFDGRYSHVLAEGIYQTLPPVRQYISSTLDGAAIEIGYWLPNVPEGVKVPVIIDASPYHRLTSNVVTLGGMKMFLHDNFLPHGYAVAAVSVRGTGNSGGCMDLMGAKEVKDLDQAITWLGTQPWSNGNVAMIGVSYDGSTPWDVAATGNKHLKTIVPISGLPDIFGLMYRNGSSEQRGALLVNALYYTYGPSAEDMSNPDASQQRGAMQRVQGTACPDYIVGLEGAAWATALGDRDPTGYWAERNRKPAIEKNYKGSVLHVQGIQDWNVDPALTIPWTSQLNASGTPLKMMLGQWGHMSPDNRRTDGTPALWTRYDWAEILLHWFDHELKGLMVDTGPAVQIQDHTGRWHNEDNYPPRDAVWTAYHLDAGNKLSLAAPSSAGSVQLVPNPSGQAGCEQLRAAACQSVEWGVVAGDEGLTFSGLPRFHVTVNPQGPGGYVAAFLYDIDEKGVSKEVGWTTMNLMYADGTENRKAVVPGADLLVKMEFQPLDAYIAPGHRLVVRLWQYQDHDRLPSVPPAPITIKFGGSVKSILDLPVIERGAESYFQPPMPPAK